MATPIIFTLSGDHVALDFVNTLDDRFSPDGATEKLTSYGDLLSFAVQVEVLTAAEASALSRVAKRGDAASALRTSIHVRELLARIFYSLATGQSVAGHDLKMFNEQLREIVPHRVLTQEAGRFVWKWEGLAKELEAPLWPVVHHAAELMTSPNIQLVRQCGRENCRWLFLDMSKNHSRRWCDMNVCGNRVKARRYYELHGRE